MSEEEITTIKRYFENKDYIINGIKVYDVIQEMTDLIEKQQKEIKKLKERIKGAIRFLEGCKTDSGTYVLFLSETEYLSEILKEK